MGLNRWLGCIENPRTGREADAVPAPTRRPTSQSWSSARARRPAGRHLRGAAGHSVVVLEREAEAGGQVRWAAKVPNRAEFGDIVRNQLNECERAGVEIRFGVEATADAVLAMDPDVVDRRHGFAAGPALVGPARAREMPVIDVTDVLTGAFTPSGRVVVIDEVGFHQATSVAELLADRGCEVEVLSPGMVVGQDLGITLDMENWWLRANAKGIVQTTDSVSWGSRTGRSRCCTTPPGRTRP